LLFKIIFFLLFVFCPTQWALSQNTLYEFNVDITRLDGKPSINGTLPYITNFQTSENFWRGGASFGILKKTKFPSVYIGAFARYQMNEFYFSSHEVSIADNNYFLKENYIIVCKGTIGVKINKIIGGFTLSSLLGLNINWNDIRGYSFDEDQLFQYVNLEDIKLRPTTSLFYGFDVSKSFKIYKNISLNLGLEYGRNHGNNVVTNSYKLSYSIYSFHIGCNLK
jgi:hypothetical protein